MHLRAGDDFYVVNDENTIGDETRVATTYTKKLLEIGDKIGMDLQCRSFRDLFH